MVAVVVGLSKTLSYTVSKPKMKDDQPLFLLTQPDIETVIPQSRQEITTEETDSPVIEMRSTRIPLMGADGKQVSYQPTVLDEETGEQVPSGDPILCWTSEAGEFHKENEHGEKLYYKTITEDITITEPQPALEITMDDAGYVEGLEMIMEDVIESKTVSFDEDHTQFNYWDVLPFKEAAEAAERADRVINRENVDNLGMGVAMVFGDVDNLGMTVVDLLMQIDQLKQEVEGLKNA
jgi:hypothetical protein